MIRLTLVAAVFAAVCGYFVVSASATVPEQNTEKRMSGIGPAVALKNGPDGQQKIIRRIAQQSDFPTRRKRGVGGRVPPDPNKGKTTDGQQEKMGSDLQKADFPTRRKRGVGGRVPPDPNKGKTTDGQQEKMGSDLQQSDFPTRRKRGGGGRVPGDPY